MPDVIAGYPGISVTLDLKTAWRKFNAKKVKYLFTFIDSGGNRTLYNLPSWPATYQVSKQIL